MDRINTLMKQVSVFWNESYLGVDLGVSISVGSILAFSWLLRRKVPQLLLWIIGRIFGANRRPVLHDLLEAIRSPLEITMLVIGLLLALHVAGLDSLKGGSVHLVLRSCVILIVFWTLVRMVGPTLTHSLGEDSQTGEGPSIAYAAAEELGVAEDSGATRSPARKRSRGSFSVHSSSPR